MEQGPGDMKSAGKSSLCKIRLLAIFSMPKKNAFNIATHGDLGWCTALTKQRLTVLRLFFHIQGVNDNKLIKNIQMRSCTIKQSWEYRVKNIIEKCNFSTIVESNYTSKYRLVYIKKMLSEMD